MYMHMYMDMYMYVIVCKQTHYIYGETDRQTETDKERKRQNPHQLAVKQETEIGMGWLSRDAPSPWGPTKGKANFVGRMLYKNNLQIYEEVLLRIQ